MGIHIYNSLSRRTEPLETLEPGVVRMYVCGVTVYDDAHVGHAMSAIVFDVIRRYLEWRGYRVLHIVNFTDIDDKIIARANAIGHDPAELAEDYIQDFLAQTAALHILPATFYPRATQTMPEILQFITDLIDKGYAYPAHNGDVYFRVGMVHDYGKLSGRSLDDILTQSEPELGKESPADFALWKAAKPDEPFWESPWGHGRPGWHIECSAMNLKHLGEQIDIHGGGTDLIFPHHENEIAQSEAMTGKPFARYWIHNGMLQMIDTNTGQIQKMSKSLGNLVTMQALIDDGLAETFRMMVLGSHYRKPLMYSHEIVADNQRKLERLRSALEPPTGTQIASDTVVMLQTAQETARTRFVEAMDDDFNTAGSLAALFDLVRAINTARDTGLSGQAFTDAQTTLRELAGVLGLTLVPPPATAHEAAPFIDLLLEVRTALRTAKQFQLSDTIRDRLADLGVTIEDTPQGTRWR